MNRSRSGLLLPILLLVALLSSPLQALAAQAQPDATPALAAQAQPDATPALAAQAQPDATPALATTTSDPAPAPTEPAESPMVFSEDFEAYGDSSRWSSDHPFPVQRDIVADGLYAARLTNEGGSPVYGQRHLNQNYDRLYVRLRFNVIDSGSKPVTLFQLRSTETGSVISIRVDHSGQISWVTGATGITSSSTPVATAAQWHDLQVMIDTSTSKNNIQVWLDDQELTTMRQSAWLGDGGMRIFLLGDNTAGRHSDIAFDDIRVDKSFIRADRPADPVPGTLTVRTIPPWEGIEFELDGQIFTTDRNGLAKIHVARWSTDLRNRIVVHDTTRKNEKVSFSSWHSWKTAHSQDVYAMFSLWQPVTFSFVDMYGNPIDTSMIDTLVIKNSIGEIYTLNRDQLNGPILLISSAVSTPQGLTVKPITYYVDQVTINGANVVNRSQQRATLTTHLDWQISLLFYGVTFQPRDALFGTSLGHSVTVRAPDGTESVYPLDKHGNTAILQLPRGDYDVRVTGGGYSPPRPIRISRDQVVQLEVISRLDVALLGGVAAMAVLGLVIAGRPFLVTKPVSVLAGILPSPRRAPHGGVGS